MSTAPAKPLLTAPKKPVLTAPPKPKAAAPVLPRVTAVSPYATTDAAWHLLRRAAYGPSPVDVADVRRLGYAGWVDQQLTPTKITDTACDAILKRLPSQSEPIWHVRDLLDTGRRNGWEQTVNVSSHHVARALWSKRQLLTVMEDFWGNHFNVTTPGSETTESRAHYSHTIRVRALGRFADLLRATSMHPAMLTYLGNRYSEDTHPNENQGRELLELHSVGVDAGYTETDVINAARVLTGLSVNNESGEYQYKPWYHWVGPVRIMGWRHANSSEIGGQDAAVSLFAYLARHPATATFICRKLAVRFVSDNPPASFVAALAKTYLANDTAIAPVIRQILLSQQFAISAGAKAWRPLDQYVSTMRLLGATITDEGFDGPQGLWYMAGSAGHTLFGAPFPTGHDDVASGWTSTSTTLARWNSLRTLSHGWWPDFERPELRARLVGTAVPATHGELVDAIARKLFGRTMSSAHTAAALGLIDQLPANPLRADSAALNWRLADLVSVMLDSPYHVMR